MCTLVTRAFKNNCSIAKATSLEVSFLFSEERRFSVYNILLQLGILIVLVLAVILIYFRLRKNRSIRIINASLTVEELELRAKRTAIDHVLTTKRVLLNWPVTRVNESYKKILDLYTELNDNLNHKRSVPPAAEWLLEIGRAHV